MASSMEEQLAPDRSTRTANAFSYLSVSPPINLLHRYESRLQRNYHRAMDTLMRLREDDRREEAWTEENAPLQEVRPSPDTVSAKPPEPPLPPPPQPEVSATPMVNSDLPVPPTILQPVPPSRRLHREQKVRNEANPISGQPAETAQTAKTPDVLPRTGTKASGRGRS